MADMRLMALSIGTRVPTGPFRCVVRSVFDHAAIVTVTDSLVTLVPAAAGGLPAGIAVDTPHGFNFGDILAVGTAGASRGGVLRFAGSTASVDLRVARPWRSRLRSISLDFASPAIDDAWRSVAAALRADGRFRAISRLAHETILLLSDAARDFDIRSAGEAAGRLVGLGSGGTPAGDDLLVGYLTGLWSAIGRSRRRAIFAGDFGQILLGLAKRTNDVSRVYLEAAVACEASERLVAVATRIAAGASSTTIAEEAASAIAVGHSSGADGTLGLLLGLAAWGPEPIFAAGRRLVDEASTAAV